MRFVLFLFLISFQSLAVKIQIIDAETKQPVPYVSFIRITDNKGSFADENGYIFIIEKLNEPHYLSSIGYESTTFIPNEGNKIIYLKPHLEQLPDAIVYGNNIKIKPIQVGKLKRIFSGNSAANLVRKMTLLNYFPVVNTEKNWIINSIKMDIFGSRNKFYKAFVIRLLIREEVNGLPGKDLLKKDWVVQIKANNSVGYEFDLLESIIMPKNGCFVGFETIGKIKKDNSFIPFDDFYVKPEKPFLFNILEIKSDALSLFKMGSFNAWFNNKSLENKADTYAIAIDVVETY